MMGQSALYDDGCIEERHFVGRVPSGPPSALVSYNDYQIVLMGFFLVAPS